MLFRSPGLVNRDFSDVRTIMTGMGYAIMGTASARGENACVVAAEKAISSPLMESGGVRGARGVLINITGSAGLGLHEVNEACSLIAEATENDDVQVNFGVVMDEAMGEEVKVTVIATGFVRENLPQIQRKGKAAEAVATATRPAPQPEPEMEPEEEPEFAFAEAAAPEPAPADRKSTRLNSSH